MALLYKHLWTPWIYGKFPLSSYNAFVEYALVVNTYWQPSSIPVSSQGYLHSDPAADMDWSSATPQISNNKNTNINVKIESYA